MSTITPVQDDALLMEQVLLGGDLSRLAPAQRVQYYRSTCSSLGLNPLTKPFDYIVLNGKLTLYAKRDATDQLRKIHAVSVTIPSREQIGDAYVVTARATTPEGRTDESTGAVSIANLKGEALANAMMKAETKAKRRVTLSIVGLGWLDETEVASVPGGQAVQVDQETGEITDQPNGTALQRLEAAMTRTGMTEAQALQTARKLFGSATQKIRLLADLSDEQIDHLIGEIEVAPKGAAS